MFTSTNVGLYFRVSEAKILQHRGRMRAKVKMIFNIKKLFFSKFASFVYITHAEKYVLEIRDTNSTSGDRDINDVCYRTKLNKVYKMMLMCTSIHVWYTFLTEWKNFSTPKSNESHGI